VIQGQETSNREIDNLKQAWSSRTRQAIYV